MDNEIWQSLVLEIVKTKQLLKRPIIQGILGPIGIGKTTLSRIITKLLAEHGLKAFNVSLDDLYKTYKDRILLQQKDSRLIWRGPPGTHDVSLGLKLFQEVLQNKKDIAIWRFDKSLEQGKGDRLESPEILEQVDVLLFEGWFVGIRPIDLSTVKELPRLISTQEDFCFAKDCNQRLTEYLPLWNKIDQLVVLYPEDYRYSLQWRQEAEQKQQVGMSSSEVEEFVNYFWRALHPELYLIPFAQNSPYVDLVIEIDRDHQPKKLHHRP